MDLTEAEDIKKRWQEYTEELHKKSFMTKIITMVWSHLEPDILECEVIWALGSITTKKASGGDGIPANAISNPKRWCCESAALNMPGNLENSTVLSCPPQRAMPKTLLTTIQLHSSHMLANSCSKFSKPGFNSTWTENFQIVKLDLEKPEEPEIKLPTYVGSSKKQKSSRKNILLLYWLCKSLCLCGSQQTVENSSRDGDTRPPDLPPEKSVCRSRSNSQNWTWNMD